MKTIHLDEIKSYEHSERVLTPRYHTVIGRDDKHWMVTGDTTIRIDDFPVLLRIDGSTKDRAILDAVYGHAINHKWEQAGIRRIGSGGGYTGASFGTGERSYLKRKLAVSITHFTHEYPDFSGLLELMVQRGWRKLKRRCPEMYDNINSAPKALKCWRISGTPFTSGVINASVTMPYHRDRNNVPATGSLMWISRRHVKGGHLHIPELGIIVDCRHGTLLVYYGETFWHGVTLIRGLSRAQAGRFSIVAYSKLNVLAAQSPAVEDELAALRGTASMDDVRDTALKEK